jgi:hypothetical protein
VTVDPTAAFAQLQLGFTAPTQRRYEVIRPLLLFKDRTATQRARETATHPDTVRTVHRHFGHQGMLGAPWACGGRGPGENPPDSGRRPARNRAAQSPG